jgi:hypothetical protein
VASEKLREQSAPDTRTAPVDFPLRGQFSIGAVDPGITAKRSHSASAYLHPELGVKRAGMVA